MIRLRVSNRRPALAGRFSIYCEANMIHLALQVAAFLFLAFVGLVVAVFILGILLVVFEWIFKRQ